MAEYTPFVRINRTYIAMDKVDCAQVNDDGTLTVHVNGSEIDLEGEEGVNAFLSCLNARTTVIYEDKEASC